MWNPYLVLETEWKSCLVWLSRPPNTILAFLGQFWSNFGPILAKMDQIRPFKAKILRFYVQFTLSAWNWTEKWSCLTLYASYYHFGIFALILAQIWPKYDPLGQKFEVLYEIHAQCLKQCRKLVLFGSLGLLIRFWHFGVNFGPILA